MRKIHVIGNQLSFRDYHHPIRVFQNDLLDLGLEVKFFTSVDAPGIYACDILIFHEDNYRDMLPIEHKDRNSALNFLQVFFKKFPKVIWFDGNDSSGWLRSYIFPYIDIYAKSQLMKDFSYYRKRHPTGVIHRDYVKEKFNINDSLVSKDPISEADCKKIRLSWGRNFKNWNYKKMPMISGLIDKLSPQKYHFKYTLPNLSQRNHFIQYRVNYWEKIPTINWWRTRTREKLDEIIHQNPPYHLTSLRKVKLNRYLNELRNSVVTVSPFGLNEKCNRDYWSFITGSLLFKPNMDHLYTFPNLYETGTTYVSHDWDFSNFNEKLEDILRHPENYEKIAREGQNRFKLEMADGAGFAQQFNKMIPA